MTPYDLEVLREHVRAMRRRGHVLRLEVRLPEHKRRALLRGLGDLARYGVEVICSGPEP